MSTLTERTIRAIGTDECAAFRSKWLLCGYVVVGSTALMGASTTEDQDTDVVLLSEACSGMGSESVLALSELCTVLQHHPHLQGVVVWFVNATVNILKLQTEFESLDLLWLSECVFPRAAVSGSEEVEDERQIRLLSPCDGWLESNCDRGPHLHVPPLLISRY